MHEVCSIIWKVAFAMCLAGCNYEPTPLDIPEAAIDAEQFKLSGMQAFQTQFGFHAAYPATPVLDFYKKRMPPPWVLCEWGPEWSNFGNAQQPEPFDVHQQLHMWVNPEARRSLMLSMRYHSKKGCCETPDNDLQHIVLVEYMGEHPEQMIERLGLRCPSDAAVH